MNILYKATVTGDWLPDGVNFNCYLHSKESWNGFACPFFTKEEGIKQTQLTDSNVVYVEELDVFVSYWDEKNDNSDVAVRYARCLNAAQNCIKNNTEQDGIDGEEYSVWVKTERETVDGTLHLYCIGGWYWTWY